jgi:hypothetical protein
MDFAVGTEVRFIESHRPRGVELHTIGTVVDIEKSASRWQPRVRVRFENYLSGCIWAHFLERV